MATKKEGAQRILDAHASSKTVRRRLLPVAIGIVLVCGLLMQYAVERMNTILEASVASGLKAMGWDADTTLDEETLENIRRIAQR